MKENKRKYEIPMVELIEARVEKGFQGSATADGLRGSSTEGLTDSGNSFDGNDFD